MTADLSDLSTDYVKEFLSEEGFEVTNSNDPDVFQVKDLESGMQVTCALQENVLFNTLPCFNLSSDKITLELTRLLLDANNGLSTSAFQLFEVAGGDQNVALTNFCKLQDMGAEDRDDILSCISFLLVDVLHARQLLANYI